MQKADDLYEVLNVPKSASSDDIKKAFRKLAMEHHPDKTNGGKASEERFKKINEAYTVLSDPEKRKTYDQFGTVDGQPNVNTDLNEIFRNMFGGGSPFQANAPGFSFVFMDGNSSDGQGIFDDFPGFPFGSMHGKKKKEYDVVDIYVDICDIYYGNSKRVEFELLDQCDKCNGTGAHDPSQIITCISCNGQGSVTQQLGPFFVQKTTCPSCMGKGNVIKNNKQCMHCKGEKTMYTKRIFELKIPKGIPHNHEIKMEKKGSYNIMSKSHKDMLFRFKHKIESPYTVDEHMNVTLTIDITIEELLAGFYKSIQLYKEPTVISSDKYFNPEKIVTIKDKGLYNIRKQKHGDLYIKFNIVFTDGDRLVKYTEVLQKILKKHGQQASNQDSSQVYNIHDLV